MTKHDLSSRHFQRKISEFCALRIAPIASRRVLENIRPYLASLIIYRKSPPLLNGHIDWTMISQACGIEAELTAELKKQLRPGLDAIIRWLGAPPVAEERRPPKPTVSSGKMAPARKAASARSARQPQRAVLRRLEAKQSSLFKTTASTCTGARHSIFNCCRLCFCQGRSNVAAGLVKLLRPRLKPIAGSRSPPKTSVSSSPSMTTISAIAPTASP